MLRIATPDLGIGPHDQRLASGASAELMRAPRRAEMQPSGASALAQPAPACPERDQRVRELFFDNHGAAAIDAIERGAMGEAMRLQWHRHRSNAEKHWPFCEPTSRQMCQATGS